jgi:hypothetical protein
VNDEGAHAEEILREIDPGLLGLGSKGVHDHVRSSIFCRRELRKLTKNHGLLKYLCVAGKGITK